MYSHTFKMTLFQSLCHYIVFALQVSCFAFMNLVISVVVGVVTTTLIGWTVGGIAVVVGCWLYGSITREDRKQYPYLCPTPKY